MFKKVSNWGRWGKDDELGAGQPRHRSEAEAGRLAREEGKPVALNAPADDRAAPGQPSPFEHTDEPRVLDRRPTDVLPRYAHSHMDALCHILLQGPDLFNGYAKTDVNTEKGCIKLGIQNMKTVTDARHSHRHPAAERPAVSRARRARCFVEDIEAWEKKAGMKVSSGDALLAAHRPAGRAAQSSDPGTSAQNEAGSTPRSRRGSRSAVSRSSAATVALDVIPSMVQGINLPVHTLIIGAMGVHIFDQMDLEAVADTAARLNRWDFMLTAAPVPVLGRHRAIRSTQSPRSDCPPVHERRRRGTQSPQSSQSSARCCRGNEPNLGGTETRSSRRRTPPRCGGPAHDDPAGTQATLQMSACVPAGSSCGACRPAVPAEVRRIRAVTALCGLRGLCVRPSFTATGTSRRVGV